MWDRELHQLPQRLTRHIVLYTSSTITIVAHPSTRTFSPPVPPNAETMPTTSPWKQDSNSGREFDSAALWRVLRYMNTGDYADESSESLDSEGLLPLSHPYPGSRCVD